MSAPTNISALTATPLGTLPATVTQQVDFSGTTYTVWYSFLAPTACVVAGAFAFGDLTTYTPTVAAFSGPASAPVSVLSITGLNVPIQFPVTAGDTYYLRVAPNSGNPTPANLTLTLRAASTNGVSVGTILINDDTAGFPMAALSATTGSVSQFFAPFPAGEGGSIVADGTTIWEDISASNHVKIFTPQLSLAATVTVTWGSAHSLVASSNKSDQFYVGDPGGGGTHAKVGTVSKAGALGATVYDLGAGGLTGMAPSNDETILYYGGKSGSISPVSRWDLINNVALSDLVAILGTYQVGDMLVLGDGTVLVLYHETGSTIVKHYSAAGATLNTYDFGSANAGSVARLAAALDDPVSFWIWLHLASGNNQIINTRISTGAAIATLEQPSFENGTFQGTATATPTAFFGASQSCPFVIARAAVAPPSTTTTYPVRRLRQTAHLSDEQVWLFFSKFQLDCETGVGLNSGQGSDPQVMLSWSDDGGHTWSEEQWMSAGKIGEYKRRVIWRRLGRSRDRVWRIVVSDPVAWRLLTAYIDVTKGSS